jgi:hypothetical protein
LGSPPPISSEGNFGDDFVAAGFSLHTPKGAATFSDNTTAEKAPITAKRRIHSLHKKRARLSTSPVSLGFDVIFDLQSSIFNPNYAYLTNISFFVAE